MKLIKILVVLILIWMLFFTIDSICASRNHKPIFCFSFFGIFSYQDGGTTEFLGLGYKVIDFHRLVLGYEGWEGMTIYNQKVIVPIWKKMPDVFNEITIERIKSN